VPRVALTDSEISAYRERIIEAASRLFAAEGFEAVTLRAIATEIGCSPMTPYRYFRDKDEIFALVRAEAFRRFADAQERVAAATDEPAETLARLGRAYVEFALAEPDAYRFMFELHQDTDGDYPELAEQGTRAWLPMREAVSRAIAAGTLEGDADTVAHVFWSGLHGLVSLHLAGKLRLGLDLEQLVEPMMRTLFNGNAVHHAAKEIEP
jgi:AcrR family transcriptional regulator